LDAYDTCKPVILLAMWSALRETFTNKKHVIASFNHCGMWPLDFDRIRVLVTDNSAPLGVVHHHLEAVDTMIKNTLDASKTPTKDMRKSKIRNVKRNLLYHSMDLTAHKEEARKQGMLCVVFGDHWALADLRMVASS
jgi:hypothetical protein